jgi:hypothetical protein
LGARCTPTTEENAVTRILQERLAFPNGIKCEWEPSSAVDTRYMTDAEVTAWVRVANKKAKAEGNWTQYRSLEDNSGDRW